MTKKLVDKAAEKRKDNFYLWAGIFGIGGMILLYNGDGSGVFGVIIGVILGWIGSKIKTTYNKVGGVDIYK